MSKNNQYFKFREFQKRDIASWIEQGGNINDLFFLLCASSRYVMEEEKMSFLCQYVSNYDNSIRIAIADEMDNISAVITVGNIDFALERADIFLGKLSCYEVTAFCNIIRNIINWVKSYTGLKYLQLSSDVALLLDCMHNDHRNEGSDDSISVSDYCIMDIIHPQEKKFILKYFDKYMYIPISTREDYERVVFNISSAADMMLAYNRDLLGFVAFYDNDVQEKKAYISSIAVDEKYRRRGIAGKLFNMAIARASVKGMKKICLEVNSNNIGGIEFYSGIGMEMKAVNGINIMMEMNI